MRAMLGEPLPESLSDDLLRLNQFIETVIAGETRSIHALAPNIEKVFVSMRGSKSES